MKGAWLTKKVKPRNHVVCLRFFCVFGELFRKRWFSSFKFFLFGEVFSKYDQEAIDGDKRRLKVWFLYFGDKFFYITDYNNKKVGSSLSLLSI